MNFYQLFHRVAQKVESDLNLQFSEVQLESAINDLQVAWHEGKIVNYDTEIKRLAYTICCAPRHATYWKVALTISDEYRGPFREYKIPNSDKLRLNCIGSGPGSEIAALICNGDEHAIDFHFNIFEVEHGWWPYLSALFDILDAETSHRIFLYESESLSELENGWNVIGSYVLTDVFRSAEGILFWRELCAKCKNRVGLFVDTYNYLDIDGRECHIADAIEDVRSWTVHLHRQEDIGKLLKAEADEICVRTCCKIPTDPRVAMFKVRF